MQASRSQSAADLVYEALKADILNFTVPPGETLAEEALSRQYEVSRTPVRDALRRLEHEGLSETRGRSRVVRLFNVTAYEGIYRVRIALECLAVEEAAETASEAQIQELANGWHGPTPTAKVSLDGEFVHADERFHLGLAAMAGNDYLVEMLTGINDRIRALRRVDFTTRQRIESTEREHAEILHLISHRDGRAAKEAMERHIQKSKLKIRARLPDIVARPYMDTNEQFEEGSRGE